MSNPETFKIVDYIKNEIIKERDRREIFIVVVGMKSDLGTRGSTRQVDETGNVGETIDSSMIIKYLESEKLTHFECTVR